jgi:molybdopterin converting factor subunit 1
MAKAKPPPCAVPRAATAAIRVRVLFFASLYDLMGERRRDLQLPVDATIADALHNLSDDVPEFATRAPHVSYALNEAFVSADAPLSDGDELALIPPVSGG